MFMEFPNSSHSSHLSDIYDVSIIFSLLPAYIFAFESFCFVVLDFASKLLWLSILKRTETNLWQWRPE